MDQPVWFLRMRATLREAGYFDEAGTGATSGGAAPDPLASLPMSSL